MSYNIKIDLFRGDEKVLEITRIGDDYKADVVSGVPITQKELSELLILGACELAQKLGGGKFTIVIGTEGN